MTKAKTSGGRAASDRNKQNTAPQNEYAKTLSRREGLVRKIVPKSISMTRSDIATWQAARRQATNAENPKRVRLQLLIKDVRLDAHLTSQIELRILPVLATPFSLKKRDGNPDEAATQMLMSASWVQALNRHILESDLDGPTVVEFEVDPEGALQVVLLPRENIIPEKGILLLNQSDDKGIDYRNSREYGTWILEFGDPSDFGLLNKAIPHVLFMRFAQACWSELCEIYGIPPRYIKTDTTDPEMLDRAEAMLRDMGSAAYFIIDTTEEFQFAKGADTNGDVYKNLMGVCKEAISVLINGAQVGQDTEHGNRSKEESSQKLLDNAQKADRRRLEMYWNEKVIPALVRIGVLAEPLTFQLQPEEDPEKLWNMAIQLLPYKDIPNEWIEQKFGIQVTDKAVQGWGMYNNSAETKKLGLLTRLFGKFMGRLSAKDQQELRTEIAPLMAGGTGKEEKDFFA